MLNFNTILKQCRANARRPQYRCVRRPVIEFLTPRMLFDTNGFSLDSTAEAEASGMVPDFSLVDANPNSAKYGDSVSPHDYHGRVTGWFFADSTSEFDRKQFADLHSIEDELVAENPADVIEIVGINEVGSEQGVALMVEGQHLPLLQDLDANHDGEPDARSRWLVVPHELVVLNAELKDAGVINLATYDLENSDNFLAVKQIFAGVLHGRAFWKNPTNPLDVGGDGQMSAVDDVLHSINELNHPSITAGGRLPLPMPGRGPAPYFDVNGDGFLSAVADILPVINFFGRNAGEGEGPSAATDEVDRPAGTMPLLPTVQQHAAEVTSSPSTRSRRLVSLDSENATPAYSHTAITNIIAVEDQHTETAHAWDKRPAELLDLLTETQEITDI